ncbi:anti-sigma factor [Pandoraea nosoerga]|uniref:anti-sigma factor family protein n=2 Tax=Pandoraea nosoerga TaxID=2508296 RepID=UPI001981A674|nr:anti-sigma factor [Pandoraea nosoerga]MBN4665628.1 anti-sigma factor [Pandoraea nosoerga]MBN4675673.1 anti-sigma factor [Pandoraea nosoerga]MBN4680944.1 anti-sigma factor [Pandoraea nosoerga]MBN4744668.1 anti-sigma factor [Pandoraea nosoerga]
MHEDDIRLLAFVDDELPAEQRAEVEAAIAASPDLADVVASLRASRLPYAAAFAAQSMPPLPERLVANVESLLRTHAQRKTPGVQTAGATPDALGSPAAGARVGEVRGPGGRRLRAWWLAAAFAAGVAAGAVALPLLSSLPGGAHKGGPGEASVTTASAAPPKSPQGVTWVRAAAEYQQMYVRETIASLRVDESETARTVSDIRRDDRLDVRVPDLRAQGLTFKRVQRLRWQDRALVQIVYLPEHGDPVALCLVPDARADQGVAEQRIERMGVLTWRKAQIGYALIGAPGSVDLKAVADALANGPVAPLYGSLMERDREGGRAS